MSDDEGNEAGSIACMGDNVEVETIPVMRERLWNLKESKMLLK